MVINPQNPNNINNIDKSNYKETKNYIKSVISYY